MGNNQSTTRSNRLSKPKTNTNSPSAALHVESPVSVTSRYADLSAKGRQQIKDTLLSPTDTEHGSASWPNNDDGTSEPAPQLRGRPSSIISRSNSKTNSRANSRTNSLSCFGNKHGSATKLTGFADSKLSLTSNTQVDLEAAIKLLQEVRKNASPEDLAALHEALEPIEDSVGFTSEQELSRNASLVYSRSSSLTRRRSLIQTPGVATRNSPVEGRRRTWNSWRAPKLEADEEAKWQVTPKGISPPTRVSILKAAEEAHHTPTPRAQTPSDMDYSHLGSLQLGTLMVTNGPPSPAPSTKITKQKSTPTEQDYFSTTEAGSSPLLLRTGERRGHVKSKSVALPTMAPFHSDVPLPSTESVSKTSRHNQAHTSWAQQTTNGQPPAKLTRSLQITTVGCTDNLTHNANRFAQSYQEYIPSSPFVTSEKMNDDTFQQDQAQSFTAEATQILQGTMFELEASSQRSDSKSSGATLQSPSIHNIEKPRGQRPPPRTVDSGYSSGESLRAIDQVQPDCPTSVALPSRNNLSKQPRDNQQRPMPKSILSRSSVQSIDSTSPLATNESTAQIRQRPSSLMILSGSTQSSAMEVALSPQTPQSIASKASFESTKSSKLKRLHRSRPSQPDLPIVQSCQSISEGTIPDVPATVRTKFARRLSNTPGMECLTNTYVTKDHVFVDAPAVDHSVRAAGRQSRGEESPSEVMNTPDHAAQTEFDHFAELEPEQPPTPPVHGRRRSLSLFRRKSTVGEKEPEDATLSIIDLGTIAASLGTSPYDAAMTGLSMKTVTSPTHPHQLGNSQPRAKSMTSEAAAEFARMRSHDRSIVERDMTQQRRRSYHNLKMESGEAKAAKRRPQSVIGDIPPVPFIDKSKLAAPRPVVSHTERESQKVLKADLDPKARTHERSQTSSAVVSKVENDKQRQPQQCVDWSAHSQNWSRRRKSIGEGLRTNYGIAELSASNVNSRTMPQNTDNAASWGRFSGGLDYGYEGRGVGVGGSAGTRQLNSYASSKSMKWRVQHGVDLSDVPIMLQRV